MAAFGYERTFWGPLIFVRFTPQSRHTKAQCPLLGLYSRGPTTAIRHSYRSVVLMKRYGPSPNTQATGRSTPGTNPWRSPNSSA